MKRLIVLLVLLLALPAVARPPLRLPAPERIVAIGDLHGDFDATRRALRLAGAIDDADRWIGGELMVVQTGDQLDRGDGEPEILDLLERLQVEAAAAGGAVIVLNGNHELMNVKGRLVCTTPGGLADYAAYAPAHITAGDTLLENAPPEKIGRLAAFRPGGPLARRLADRNEIQIVGDNLFVHGGVAMRHVEYGPDRINDEVAAWMRGEGPRIDWMHKRVSPTWSRLFSQAECDSGHAELAEVLDALGVERMLVGHTIQEGGIGARYDGRVWCLDVGMSAHYGGPIEVLEIRGDETRVLREPWAVRAQRDTVGFATRVEDMAAVTAAALSAEGLEAPDTSAPDTYAPPFVGAILPHDDHLYTGRTVVHALDGLRARRWVILGVCHACRREGVRDRLIFESADAWDVGGERVRVSRILRHELLSALGDDAIIDDDRHAAEHSVEALIPWLRQARPDAAFVPILVPGLSRERMKEVAEIFGRALAEICYEERWTPGEDVGVLISADAVHYGCAGWGDRPYDPFGCDEAGHAAAIAQDLRICNDCLSGELSPDSAWCFANEVWDESTPEYPYQVTWCGVYSIPFGLLALDAWMDAAERPAPVGRLLRYGDSASDGRLPLGGTRLGVTAPSDLHHWVGYAAVEYVEEGE